jgi:hypothetical protein
MTEAITKLHSWHNALKFATNFNDVFDDILSALRLMICTYLNHNYKEVNRYLQMLWYKLIPGAQLNFVARLSHNAETVNKVLLKVNIISYLCSFQPG